MIFYIEIRGASTCFAKSIKKLCRKMGYKFIPNNKSYYRVNTDSMTCVGVDSAGGQVVREGVSHVELKNKFVKR